MSHNDRTKSSLKSALKFGVGMGALFASFAAPSHAQEVEEAEESRTLQTVTVTATKREQTLQDIPVAVSVVDETVLQESQLTDILDLQTVVPALRVSQLQQSGNSTFIIRGFGNGGNNIGVEPSVAVYIDGVFRTRAAGGLSDYADIERIEVLRGPQSTLFGKNSSAGVINVVTQKPQFEFGGSLEATLGNFDSTILKGVLTGPITDQLAFSVSGSFNERDGYAENIATGTALNDRDRFAVKGQLLYEPTEDISLRFIADYDEIDEVCCFAPNVFNGPTGAAVGGVIGDAELVNASLQGVPVRDPFSFQDDLNFDPTNEITNSGFSLEANFATPFGELTYIGSLREQDLESNADADFGPADLISSNLLDYTIDTQTHELRLAGSQDKFDYLIGGFYFDESIDQNSNVFTGGDFRAFADELAFALAGVQNALAFGEAIFGADPGSFFEPGTGTSEIFSQENESISLFAQGDYRITDSLTATVGLGYIADEKSVTAEVTTTEPFSAIPLPAAFGAFEALQFLPPFVDFPNSVEDGETNDDQITYTAKLAYDFNDNINVYGSYATGYKASSWNLTRDSSFFPEDEVALAAAGLTVPNRAAGTRFAGPEDTQVFELGAKLALDNLNLNVAIFDQTIEGFQSTIFQGTGFVLANAGEQSTRGFEFDALWAPVEDLELTFSGIVQDPEFDSFENATVIPGGEIDLADGVADGVGDLSGTQPAGIAEVSLFVGGRYSFDLTENVGGFLRADYQYESDVQVVDNIEGLDREVGTLNASIGLQWDNGLDVTVWGRNLNDDEFFTSAFPLPAQAGRVSAYPNVPQTYGITVRKTF